MLTYPGVARALGFSEEPPRSSQAEAMKRGLRTLDELSRKLRRIRLARGALDLDLPEARVVLDERTGAPTDIVRRAQDPGVKRAYQMIEELMILANELVAQWLSQRRCPTIYRVHGKPDEERLARLAEVSTLAGVPVKVEDLLHPAGVTRYLGRIHKHEKRQVLETLLLRSLKQAQYDIVNIGHFGLASDSYLHFTSPIRRYPDLVVHRSVKQLLRGAKADTSPAAVEEQRMAATSSSLRERAAMEVEREVVDLYRALYMQRHVGEVFEGRVTAIAGSGVYVALDRPFVDVLVRFEALGPDQYQASTDELSVSGVRSGDRVALGDRVVVVIEEVSVLRRTTFARRVPPERAFDELEPARERPRRKATRHEPTREERRPKDRRRGRTGRGRPSRRR
jgi:ribonuclease R